MAKTVFGLMDHFSEAQASVRDLAAAGFRREHIGTVGGGKIGGLMNLGVPEEEAHAYAEGLRRGATLVTATAETDAMADRAAEIMRSHGAVDIDQRAANWRKEGWSGRLTETEHSPATAANQAAFNERVYEGEETAEEPVVSKRSRDVKAEQAAGGYNGPERRMASSSSYTGMERRKLV
jgi:hypothetical protein